MKVRMPMWPCCFAQGPGSDCKELSTRQATGNIALYGHVCEAHYQVLSPGEQKNYVPIELSVRPG